MYMAFCLPTLTNGPVSVVSIVSLVFCTGDARINLSLYVVVLELTPVTGKMFTHMNNIKGVCAIISLVEISGTEFVRYDQFDHQDGGARFQIKLMDVHLEECRMLVTRVNWCWHQVPSLNQPTGGL